VPKRSAEIREDEAMWSRREVLKTFAAAGALSQLPACPRSALAGTEPDLVLRLVAAPDRVSLRSGPKTSVLRFTAKVPRGRRDAVRVLLAPTEPGLFMYHCHNLEHEDGGMMRNCRFA
jgi:FtsP/CotA-like multicopper oxidase with cupredoxin domain